jgi:hypothetical protein
VKPITQFEARALTVRIDMKNDQAVIAFTAHGQHPVSVRLPRASLVRFLAQASAELAVSARTGFSNPLGRARLFLRVASAGCSAVSPSG